MPGKSPDIFKKSWLSPNQLRTVSDRRFDDAMCLFESGDNLRLNGEMYLGGFAIECLLKALLLERHPNLGRAVDPSNLSKSDRRIYGLLFGHDLDLMLDALPDVQAKFDNGDPSGGPMRERLRDVCEEWSVYARYSAKLAKRNSATRFLETVDEVLKCLKRL